MGSHPVPVITRILERMPTRKGKAMLHSIIMTVTFWVAIVSALTGSYVLLVVGYDVVSELRFRHRCAVNLREVLSWDNDRENPGQARRCWEFFSQTRGEYLAFSNVEVDYYEYLPNVITPIGSEIVEQLTDPENPARQRTNPVIGLYRADHWN